MQHNSVSRLSFYRSAERSVARDRTGLLITAGRCTCTTTTSSDTCIKIEIQAN